jgi:hypothetical protein
MTIGAPVFTADETAFLNSRGEDTEALGRAYGPKGAPRPNADDDDDLPERHPGMDEDKPNGNGRQKAKEAPQKAEAEEPDDDDDEDEDGSRASKFVPHGQFHKERTRRHNAEKESAELKLKFAKAEERLAILNELIQSGGSRQEEHGQPAQNGKANGNGQAKSAWDEPDIDPEEDFSGALSQLRRRQQEDREARNQWQQKTEERAKDSEQSTAYVRDAVAYAKQNPAFAHAYRHLMQTYHHELEAFGMTDREQRNQHIRNEEKKLAQFALENRQSPAAVIMQLAEARGFKFQPPQEEHHEEDDGEAPSLAKAAKEVKGKVETIKKAQKSTASLSNAGGGAKNGLTMESILAMNDDEFFEKVHKLPVSKRKKLLAG